MDYKDKIDVAKTAWLSFRGRLSVEEFLSLLTLGCRIYRSDGPTFLDLGESLLKFEASLNEDKILVKKV